MRIAKHTVCIAMVILFVCILPLSAMAISPLPSASMRIGSQGENVRLLQQNLSEMGLYHIAADGVYGPQTAAAVRALQTRLDLPADGVCGKTTIHAFNKFLSSASLSATPTAGSDKSQAANSSVLANKRIGIDAGHQKQADYDLEPIAPQSRRSKERMSAGAVGIKTQVPEYEITLQIAKKLQALLEEAGATVVMTRTKHDVQLSNAERAQRMNDANVDCWVRIHCDHSTKSSSSGIHMLAPLSDSAPTIAKHSSLLAELMLKSVSQATGAQALSVLYRSDQTGFNWSNSPVITAELGYLSNPIEDVRLNRSYYQQACAAGLYDGLVAYFNELAKK